MMRGRIRFDATASAATPRPPSITLIAESVRGDRVLSPEARPLDDGTFEMPVRLQAPTTLRARVPDGWAMRSITLNGKELEGPILAVADVSGLEVLFTNRLSTISGVVLDSQGRSAADATVLIIPPRGQSARLDMVRTALADSAGTFTMRDVLPGQYVAVALDHAEEGSDANRDWLARLTPLSTPITVTAQPLRVDLRLARTP
jgi:hypothetical protein